MVIREKVRHDGKILKAFARLHYIKGNSTPYFSLTGELVNPKRNGHDKSECGGCMHEELLEEWPELKPLAELHGSHIDGRPMYAVENGFYWLAGADPEVMGAGVPHHGGTGSFPKRESKCLANFCGLWRVSLEEAARIMLAVRKYRTPDLGDTSGLSKSEVNKAKAALTEFAVAALPRWKAEADAAIKAFGLEIEGDVADWEKVDRKYR